MMSRSPASTSDHASSRYQLRFQSLLDPNRALAFPCDRNGRVDVYALSTPACCNYVLARASIGRDYSTPIIVTAEQVMQPEAAPV